MTAPYPTFSISLNDERISKLNAILSKLRETDAMVSRSEAVGRAIDYFYPFVCPSKLPDGKAEGQTT